MPQEEDTIEATFCYNDEHTKCTVTIGECEFPDLETENGGTVFLHDPESGRSYAFVIDEEDLQSDTVYELMELETAEEEEDDEEPEPTPGPAAP